QQLAADGQTLVVVALGQFPFRNPQSRLDSARGFLVDLKLGEVFQSLRMVARCQGVVRNCEFHGRREWLLDVLLQRMFVGFDGLLDESQVLVGSTDQKSSTGT